MATDFSAFQRVLEALLQARSTAAILVATTDTTNAATDDQDCYLRGIRLNVDRSDPVYKALRFLAKHLDWVGLDNRTKSLFVSPPEQLPFRLTQVAFQAEVANSLNESGIECSPDVYYR